LSDLGGRHSFVLFGRVLESIGVHTVYCLFTMASGTILIIPDYHDRSGPFLGTLGIVYVKRRLEYFNLV
jgi:hypothetical protein